MPDLALDTIDVEAAAPQQTPSSAFMSQSSFAQTILNFTFILANNPQSTQPSTFTGTNSNILSVSGLRARVRISDATTPQGATADVVIYGLAQEIMNQLTTTAPIGNMITKNGIIISAGVNPTGDASATAANFAPTSGFAVVFGGFIWFATGDYNDMPNVALRILANAGLPFATITSTATSYTGSTSIVSIMQNFASQLTTPQGQPVSFENNGVTGNLSNPYFPGTILQQVYAAADHAGIQAELVDGGTKLAIWPLGKFRTSQTKIPLISPQTGMIGYPMFAQNGIMIVKMLYNPDVIYRGQVQIQSSITQANKTWYVIQLDLALDTLAPGGEWMGMAQLYPTTSPFPPVPL